MKPGTGVVASNRRWAGCHALWVGILSSVVTASAVAGPYDDMPPMPGDPLAAGVVKLLQDEIRQGIERRNVEGRFAQWRRYTAAKLDSTAGPRRTSEITGNARLSWYDWMMRHPIESISAAEAFTRELHRMAMWDHRGLDRLLVKAGEKLDLNTTPPRDFDYTVNSPEEALEIVKNALFQSQTEFAAAMAPLSRGEIAELRRSLYPVLTEQNRHGHTLVDRRTGRRMVDLLEKMDRNALLRAGRALVPLADRRLLEQLSTIPEEGSVEVPGVTGRVLQQIDTPAGAIVIGGRDDKVYHLDKMPDVAVVISLGGNNVYHDGIVSPDRPVLVIIDLEGDDRYLGSRPGIQGGAQLGVSMLIDVAGNDVYQAQDIAQGSAVGGVGILIDFEGDDTYVGLRRTQGQALGGIGILLDRDGDDSYRAAMWSQGFGGPFGFGLLDDLDGDDHFYLGGLYRTSYEDTPGYEGWGQGVGAGLRQVSSGGIGVLLAGGGDNVYEYDYLSHGGGYWLGMGFARDFAGNDRRLGATRVAFNGGRRSQRRFQRFSNGFGCHYALGFVFDDAGDDSYEGDIMCLGYGWDVGVGVLVDFDGNDVYRGSQGNGAQASLGVLFDYRGDDVYQGNSQGFASSSITYHRMPDAGGNFSFLVDYGGNDRYGSGARNNSYNRRGAAGGFLIDRPSQEELEQAAQQEQR